MIVEMTNDQHQTSTSKVDKEILKELMAVLDELDGTPYSWEERMLILQAYATMKAQKPRVVA